MDSRPTYGYRRIAALLNRGRRAAYQPVINRKPVHCILANHAMILEMRIGARAHRTSCHRSR
ncbi:IS3 family insertion sequence transposase domain-containing protein (plasmid) [Rhizobium sp. NXC14]|nr:IS3 family insertion sequence transposase domain-containing protein [Rhizobium sp. NXC14]